MSTQAKGPANYRLLVENGGLRAYLISQAAAGWGGVVNAIALPLLVYSLTRSGGAVGLLLVLQTFPLVAFGAPVGVFIDRWDRKRTLIWCNLIRGVLALGYAFVPTMWLVYNLVFLSATMMSLYKPARLAVVPSLVRAEDLVAANSLMFSVQQLSGIVGSALTGAVIATWGIKSAFYASALMLILSSGVVALWVPLAPAKIGRGRIQSIRVFWTDLKTGVVFLVRHPLLSPLTVVVTFLWLALSVRDVTMVVFAKRVLGVSDAGFSFLYTWMGIGALLGALLIPGVITRMRRSRFEVFGSAILAAGTFYMLFASSSALLMAVIVLTMMSAAVTSANTIEEALEQEFAPEEMRGKVISTISAIGTIGYMLFAPLSGALSDMIPVRIVTAGGAVLLVLVGIISLSLVNDRAAHRSYIQAEAQPNV